MNRIQSHVTSFWIRTVEQITQTKLEKLNVLQLYQHYGALERSFPLLTPESQDLARAELEACSKLRSEKVDRFTTRSPITKTVRNALKKKKVKLQGGTKAPRISGAAAKRTGQVFAPFFAP